MTADTFRTARKVWSEDRCKAHGQYLDSASERGLALTQYQSSNPKLLSSVFCALQNWSCPPGSVGVRKPRWRTPEKGE
jgi:hypothetical protein